MATKVYSKQNWCFPPEKKIRVSESSQLPTDNLIREIFAPDPITGNPCSDLALIIHGENQELNEYIRTHLMNSVGSRTLLGDSDSDGDAALDSLPRLSDDEGEYFSRLVKLASVNNQEVTK